MTTRNELTAALEAKGITIEDDDEVQETRIMWAEAYNLLSSRTDDGIPSRPDLLMGWHWGNQMLHISTMNCEFILEPLGRYSTEAAANLVTRFISGTYLNSILLNAEPEYVHVRDYPITD